MNYLIAILLAIGTWVIWTATSLYRSYQQARTIGLPMVISPVASLNPFWIIVTKLLPGTISLLQYLPFQLGKRFKYTYMGWQFDDKGAIHRELGPAFVLVTPSQNEVYLADAPAVDQVLRYRKSFIKPAIMYDPLSVFGVNVDTAEGETWQRHRRLTAPNFNEKVSSSVWNEAVSQTEHMLKAWVEELSAGTRDTAEDVSTLTLHVFTYAGFGLKYAFRSLKELTNADLIQTVPRNGALSAATHAMSYRDALRLVSENFTLLLIFPMASLKWPIWSKNTQLVGHACDEFKSYLGELVDIERGRITNEQQGEAKNLLSALVQANQAETDPKNALNDDELTGNLFIFNFAGHDTSAVTVSTSITYLSINPRYQDWLHEEINACTLSSSSPQSWNYEETFPRLVRCLAVMLETLRLHGPIAFLPKAAAQPSQTITVKDQTYTIPGGYFVHTNLVALHTNPDFWGSDALEWKPDRWIAKSENSGPGRESLIEPAPGTFAPWSDGPRVCPGKKFAQVESVAALAVLFRTHVVSPRQENRESRESVVQRVKAMLDDSAITSITLVMRRPRDVAMVWKER